MLIRLGTNEAYSPQLFEENMRRVVAFALERGTIPVLATKADQREANDAINTIIRNLAAEYKVPLWDFGAAAAQIPARGLSTDGVHLTYFPPDYTQPFALQSGHGLQNLCGPSGFDRRCRRRGVGQRGGDRHDLLACGGVAVPAGVQQGEPTACQYDDRDHEDLQCDRLPGQ